jgi:hypothetical protein
MVLVALLVSTRLLHIDGVHSGSRFTLILRACSFESSFSFLLNVLQSNLEVVKLKVETARFLFSFYLSPSCISSHAC